MPILRLLPLLVVLLALAPPAQARVAPDFIGITSEDVFAGNTAYRTQHLTDQRSLRIGLIRQTFDWSRIERSPGRFTLGAYDNFVAKAASHGMRVLPILFNPPSFHRRTRAGATCQPRRNATMARFAQVLVRRYGARGTLWSQRPNVRKLSIRAWQIWGEASLRQYWCPKPRAKSYVAMLKTVGRAIERVDRRAEIVTAGLPDSRQRGAVRLRRFLTQMYRAKARRYFDTLAINSYARNHRELARLVRSARKIMNRRRDRRAKIWITEIGWGDSGPRHRFVVGARGQASRISRSLSFIRRNRRRLRLRGFVYFSWRDSPPYAPRFQDLWGLHTGLLRRNGSQKPAYSAFRRAARRF